VQVPLGHVRAVGLEQFGPEPHLTGDLRDRVERGPTRDLYGGREGDPTDHARGGVTETEPDRVTRSKVAASGQEEEGSGAGVTAGRRGHQKGADTMSKADGVFIFIGT